MCQTGFVSFSKADISRTTGTCQVSVVLLISQSAFENETKPVWYGSEVASINALYDKLSTVPSAHAGKGKY